MLFTTSFLPFQPSHTRYYSYGTCVFVVSLLEFDSTPCVSNILYHLNKKDLNQINKRRERVVSLFLPMGLIDETEDDSSVDIVDDLVSTPRLCHI